MIGKTIAAIAGVFMAVICSAAPVPEKDDLVSTRIVINADLGEDRISRHLYGQFAEHLGHGIYGGIWVGEDSPIPNTNGIRNDVVEALRKLSIPNLRWPGGCFADEYHWKDGIGPRDQRPKMINTNWGGVTEDNSFGTHEFLELCEQLGTEPVICGNVGSGTVEEMADWVEYLNFDGISPMADLRRVNGREESWNVKYWGVGNESWGCGGNMTPEYYADQFRRYATFCKNYGSNRLRKIAGGGSEEDYRWTETLMKNIPPGMMWGLSLHHYTTKTWHGKRGTATDFGEPEYFHILRLCLNIEEVLDRHIAIMDQYDPQKKVALVVDEWGTWHDVEPGTNPGFLYQQNTLRDAMVAALSLNYFNERCDRIRMANIAQMVNVLQAMILTDEGKMMVTPTYHVFEMYRVHQDATLLPLTMDNETTYRLEEEEIPALSASASRDADGKIHVTLVNIHPDQAMKMFIDVKGREISKLSGRILTAEELTAHNTFEDPDLVHPVSFNEARLKKESIELEVPAKSILVLEID
jgi:alpha-N-arabinofuranosidase